VRSGKLNLLGRHVIDFDPTSDIELACRVHPELHPNGMRLRAFGLGGRLLGDETWYSTGGGFIASEHQLRKEPADDLIASHAHFP